MFYSRKTNFGVNYLRIKFLKLCQASEYSFMTCHFWRRLSLQKPLEKFSRIERIRSGYVKYFPRSVECSAFWIMAVWPTKHFLFDKVLTPPTLSHGLDADSLNFDFWRISRYLQKWRVWSFKVPCDADINKKCSLEHQYWFIMLESLIHYIVSKRAFFEYQKVEKAQCLAKKSKFWRV